MKVKLIKPTNPLEQETLEVIEKAIVEISEGVKALRSSKLNDKALFLLIQQAMPVKHRLTTKEIGLVFYAAESLKKQYLKP